MTSTTHAVDYDRRCGVPDPEYGRLRHAADDHAEPDGHDPVRRHDWLEQRAVETTVIAAGTLSSYSINANGIITGTYSNQQTAALGQIVLANFNDPNGLVDLGNNEYEATAASGQPQIGVPGGTNLGFLQGGAVEASNVDLTNELVNLITAQRNYQANAQTIKTQQTVDQTLINM